MTINNTTTNKINFKNIITNSLLSFALICGVSGQSFAHTFTLENNAKTAVAATQNPSADEAKKILAQKNIPFTVDAFAEAVKKGNLEVTKLFLDAGMSASTKHKTTHFEVPVVIIAATAGHLDIVKLLAARGADLTSKNNYNWDALIAATAGNYKPIVEFLISQGQNKASYNDALVLASYRGNLDMMELFLNNGADANAKSYSDTALGAAAYKGNLDGVKLLLRKGASLENVTDETNPLIGAVAGKNLEVVDLLLTQMPSKNVKSAAGTALLAAVYQGNAEIAKRLLASDADLQVKAPTGDTALTLAAFGGNDEIVKLLLDRGANINDKGRYGSAITAATVGNFPAIVKILEQSGAKIDQDELFKARAICIADNERSAIETMRLFHSVEVTYQAGIGNGAFGSAVDIFREDFIDAVLAEATDVPAMTSTGNQFCIGQGRAKRGYKFSIKLTDKGFVATGIAVQATGFEKTGNRNFFVDETGVIRTINGATMVPDASSKPLLD